jgi:hypothetical protein
VQDGMVARCGISAAVVKVHEKDICTLSG